MPALQHVIDVEERAVIEPRVHSVRGVKQEHSMLIPSVEMLRRAIATVPAGESTDLGSIRRELALQYGADACCPVTTQRHVVRLAEEAFRAFGQGDEAASITPFWRVVDPSRPNSRRLAGGSAFIEARRREEGAGNQARMP
jgi:hypothetical protein